MKKRHYQSFLVLGSSPYTLRDNLNKEINSLEKYGWSIDRIDPQDVPDPYYGTTEKGYLIIAYCGREDPEE